MLSLKRTNYPADRHDYAEAWGWAREQRDLYALIVGLDDFSEFTSHPGEQIDFALRDGGELIAFASLVLKGRKSCEFELITPPRPRVRSILALLGELRRLCRMFGLRQASPQVFCYSLIDHLKATEQKEQ
jgi:hypothetical protein